VAEIIGVDQAIVKQIAAKAVEATTEVEGIHGKSKESLASRRRSSRNGLCDGDGSEAATRGIGVTNGSLLSFPTVAGQATTDEDSGKATDARIGVKVMGA